MRSSQAPCPVSGGSGARPCGRPRAAQMRRPASEKRRLLWRRCWRCPACPEHPPAPVASAPLAAISPCTTSTVSAVKQQHCEIQPSQPGRRDIRWPFKARIGALMHQSRDAVAVDEIAWGCNRMVLLLVLLWFGRCAEAAHGCHKPTA